MERWAMMGSPDLRSLIRPPGNRKGGPELLRALAEALEAPVAAPLPVLVTQRNVEAIVGLPSRDYLRMARAGAFPSTKERRLVVARTSDVIRVFEQRISAKVELPPDAPALDRALARVGARRVA